MEIANHVPHMRIKWDSKKIPKNPHEVGKALRDGKPSIVLSTGEHRRSTFPELIHAPARRGENHRGGAG